MEKAICEICGNEMPEGEEMFKFHGYSCDCPPSKAMEEAKRKEEDFSKDFDSKTKERITQQIYEAATCYALANPKWKSNGVIEYIANWFE